MMNEIIVFIGGFLAAFIGSMSGGGAGFISFGILLALGLPPKSAIATNTFGDFGFFPTAVRNFAKAGQVKKKALPLIVSVSIAGGMIGTLLLVYVDERFFNILLAVIMSFVVITILSKRHLPTRERKPKKFWSVALFATKVAGGISSAGTGLLVSMTLLFLRGFTPMQALANSFVANAASSIVNLSILIFFTDLIDYRLGLFMLAGNVIGAHLGSKLAIKKGNKFVNRAIITMAVVVLIQLLVFA